MSVVKISKSEANKIRDLVKSYEGRTSPLMEILHIINDEYGFIPLSISKIIADELEISIRDIRTTATFYDFFHEKPLGKTVVRVCEGASCVVKGSEKLTKIAKEKLNIEKGKHTSEDGLFSVELTYCNGHCDKAPTVTINDKLYKEVDVFEIGAIMKEYKV